MPSLSLPRTTNAEVNFFEREEQTQNSDTPSPVQKIDTQNLVRSEILDTVNHALRVVANRIKHIKNTKKVKCTGF